MAPARLTLLTACLAVLALPAAAHGQGATSSWTCEATALRGTVLGTSIEPVVANVGAGPCKTAKQELANTGALPLPVKASAVTAGTFLGGPDDAAPRDRQVVAAGGIAGLRLQALPELPLRLPLDALLVNVPALEVPLLGLKLDLRTAVSALLGDGLLPGVDLVSVDAITAYASGACVDGRPQVFGASRVAGLRVLGAELPTDAAASQVLNLVNTASIDPSDLDVSLILQGLGLDLGIARPLVQAALDLLPDIAIPPALAHVQVTPAEQSTTADGRLVQRALRVQASLAGQPLLDLVLGEASAGGRGVDCTAPAGQSTTAADLALGCTKRKLTLIDVVPDGRRVRLLGAADRSLAGEEVDIVLEATNDVVASPTVRSDGSFSATAPLPSRKVRSSNRARYVAKVGRERSLNLKLARRMRVTGTRARGGKVTIAGRVSGPLARRAKDREIVVTRRLTCKRWEVVGRLRPSKDGRFRAVVDAPEDAGAAVYRLRSKVQATKRNRKLFKTFTLPRAVNLL